MKWNPLTHPNFCLFDFIFFSSLYALPLRAINNFSSLIFTISHWTFRINAANAFESEAFSAYSFKFFRSEFKTFILLLFFFVRDEVFELSRSKTFLIKIIIKQESIWKLFVLGIMVYVFMHVTYVIIFRSFHHHSWFLFALLVLCSPDCWLVGWQRIRICFSLVEVGNRYLKELYLRIKYRWFTWTLNII